MTKRASSEMESEVNVRWMALPKYPVWAQLHPQLHCWSSDAGATVDVFTGHAPAECKELAQQLRAPPGTRLVSLYLDVADSQQLGVTAWDPVTQMTYQASFPVAFVLSDELDATVHAQFVPEVKPSNWARLLKAQITEPAYVETWSYDKVYKVDSLFTSVLPYFDAEEDDRVLGFKRIQLQVEVKEPQWKEEGKDELVPRPSYTARTVPRR